MSDLDEEFKALMQRVLAGSDEAAKELFDGYGAFLLHAVRRRLSRRMRSRFDSQDFAQDVWASYFARSPRKRVFASPPDLIAFLASLARHKVIDAFRQGTAVQKRKIALEESLDDSKRFDKGQLAADQATPSQLLMSQEEWSAFLEKQPPVYRRVLLLVRAGKTQPEIARELRLDRRTVSRIIGRMFAETTS